MFLSLRRVLRFGTFTCGRKVEEHSRRSGKRSSRRRSENHTFNFFSSKFLPFLEFLSLFFLKKQGYNDSFLRKFVFLELSWNFLFFFSKNKLLQNDLVGHTPPALINFKKRRQLSALIVECQVLYWSNDDVIMTKNDVISGI